MVDKTHEIRDDDTTIEAIEKKIRENIMKRQNPGNLLPARNSVLTSASEKGLEIELDDSFQRDLEFIHSCWDVHNNTYIISSHRPYIGKFLVEGRKLVG